MHAQGKGVSGLGKVQPKKAQAWFFIYLPPKNQPRSIKPEHDMIPKKSGPTHL
jgi:hypothetical protein